MRANRMTTIAALAALAAAGAAGCDVQRAVDCARLAAQVTDAAADLQQAVNTESLQDDADALDELTRDVDELQGEVDDTDVRDAAQSVLDAAESVQQSAEQGSTPDLSPLTEATDELTSICTASD